MPVVSGNVSHSQALEEYLRCEQLAYSEGKRIALREGIDDVEFTRCYRPLAQAPRNSVLHAVFIVTR